MTLTDFILHLAFFGGSGIAALALDRLDEMPLRAGRWISTSD